MLCGLDLVSTLELVESVLPSSHWSEGHPIGAMVAVGLSEVRNDDIEVPVFAAVMDSQFRTRILLTDDFLRTGLRLAEDR